MCGITGEGAGDPARRATQKKHSNRDRIWICLHELPGTYGCLQGECSIRRAEVEEEEQNVGRALVYNKHPDARWRRNTTSVERMF